MDAINKKSFMGLNEHLLAEFFPLKRGEGMDFVVDTKSPKVKAALTQCSLDMTMNWQSPFEGAWVESKFPGLAQMAQAGMFSGVVKAIGEKFSELKLPTDKLQATANQMVGRTGITKINSTQVFSGMHPVKIQLTAFFKAHEKPDEEVEDPINLLQMWALPQWLAPDGVAAEFVRSNGDLLSLMPSLVPLCIGFRYKNRTFMPMVIESISDPLDAPIDRYGHRIHAAVQMTLCTLTALDRQDWIDVHRGQQRDRVLKVLGPI